MHIRRSDMYKTALKDLAVTLFILAAALLLCFLLKSADNTSAYASMLFILAVFLVSRFTHGYIFGIISSLISVLLVNFVFTYPYFAFNFTLSGYPVFIMCMLVVSIATGTLTTQNKLSEEARIEAEREKTRSNLLRAVSHDLRTPLTAISGACSVMIENDDYISADERKRLLSEITDDAHWLIRMVENLLSITRFDGGDAKIIKKHEAVEEVVADSIAKFKKQFPKNAVTVVIPNELLLVPMDVILIEQVLKNLLENAVTHSRTATEIRLEVAPEKNVVRFSVSDNGSGISEAILTHIFDGYFGRSYEQSSDKKRNMGIGLSVCNTIITAHGGEMTAENMKTGGAKFTFTLPIGEETEYAKQL